MLAMKNYASRQVDNRSSVCMKADSSRTTTPSINIVLVEERRYVTLFGYVRANQPQEMVNHLKIEGE